MQKYKLYNGKKDGDLANSIVGQINRFGTVFSS